MKNTSTVKFCIVALILPCLVFCVGCSTIGKPTVYPTENAIFEIRNGLVTLDERRLASGNDRSGILAQTPSGQPIAPLSISEKYGIARNRYGIDVGIIRDRVANTSGIGIDTTVMADYLDANGLKKEAAALRKPSAWNYLVRALGVAVTAGGYWGFLNGEPLVLGAGVVGFISVWQIGFPLSWRSQKKQASEEFDKHLYRLVSEP